MSYLNETIKCDSASLSSTSSSQKADTTLTELLSLPEFRVIDFDCYEATKECILFCEPIFDYAICPVCASVSNEIYQYHSRKVRDVSAFEWNIYLIFNIRRFYCEQCGKPFTERLESIAYNCRYTRRFEHDVFLRCQGVSFNQISQQLRLGYLSVFGIYHRQACEFLSQRQQKTLRVLGIDEIALKKGHKDYILVISDLDRGCVISVLNNRSRETLEGWLQLLSQEEVSAIETVSIDMWEPYRLALEAKLPNAKIVADRFHVMQNLNRCLSEARRAIQRLASKETKEQFKGLRWVLVKNRENLNEKEREKLMVMYQQCPQLRQLHQLKEEFRLIFEKLTDKNKAARFLNAWVCKVQQLCLSALQPFLTTLRNWFHSILNYFDNRITNGTVEGLNNRIKLIKRIGFGYRNFSNFAQRIMVECGTEILYHTY